MRFSALVFSVMAACLFAAACSSNDDAGSSTTATAEALPQPTEAGDGLSATQQEVADKIAASYATEAAVSEEQARCTAEISTAGFSDARLAELGISAEAIPDRGFTWGNYDLTTPEASTVVDATLQCMDRLNLATAFLASHGYSLDEAKCMADPLANDEEALRTLVAQTLLGESVSANTILSPHIEACSDVLGQGSTDPADSLSPDQRALADAFRGLVLADALVTTFMTRPEVICLAEGAFAVFTDERLGELGLDPESFTEAYRQPGLFVFGDWFDISDGEAFDLENLALGCVDWRNFVVQVLVSEGEPMDRAECIASQISVDALRAVVRDAMVVDTGEGFGEAQDEVASALTACYLNPSSSTVS